MLGEFYGSCVYVGIMTEKKILMRVNMKVGKERLLLNSSEDENLILSLIICANGQIT